MFVIEQTAHLCSRAMLNRTARARLGTLESRDPVTCVQIHTFTSESQTATGDTHTHSESIDWLAPWREVNATRQDAFAQ
ncbi:hypothetical protein E2C01_003822 [Portunus trituberculatus]|uniref:Uncharacterized protein n=1 Tax=Portunus trituberculatus TaxID=210409 RepID=A0A5B7CUQ3_PORTR|nr:hypothetical protein [Portunus trituberculatus]